MSSDPHDAPVLFADRWTKRAFSYGWWSSDRRAVVEWLILFGVAVVALALVNLPAQMNGQFRVALRCVPQAGAADPPLLRCEETTYVRETRAVARSVHDHVRAVESEDGDVPVLVTAGERLVLSAWKGRYLELAEAVRGGAVDMQQETRLVPASLLVPAWGRILLGAIVGALGVWTCGRRGRVEVQDGVARVQTLFLRWPIRTTSGPVGDGWSLEATDDGICFRAADRPPVVARVGAITSRGRERIARRCVRELVGAYRAHVAARRLIDSVFPLVGVGQDGSALPPSS